MQGSSGVKTLGIVGGGVLGHAICRGFMEHAECRVFDVVREKSTHYHLADVATCDIVMIALPTPANPDGTCNTLHIEDFLRTAQHEGWWKPESCYVIRSTVPIGFTQREAEKREFKLPLLHSPEFLTARCAVADFQTPARNIIGTPQLGTDRNPIHIAGFSSAKITLFELYTKRFPGVQVHSMPSNASELVKLACNTFFGAKVQLFNLFAETAKAAGVDWETVRAGIMSDGRIAHAHTQVTFDPPGFGGSCLPKDLADLYHSATGLGVDAELLREVLERNDRIRRPRDPGLTRVELPGRDA